MPCFAFLGLFCNCKSVLLNPFTFRFLICLVPFEGRRWKTVLLIPGDLGWAVSQWTPAVLLWWRGPELHCRGRQRVCLPSPSTTRPGGTLRYTSTWMLQVTGLTKCSLGTKTCNIYILVLGTVGLFYLIFVVQMVGYLQIFNSYRGFPDLECQRHPETCVSRFPSPTHRVSDLLGQGQRTCRHGKFPGSTDDAGPQVLGSLCFQTPVVQGLCWK